MHTLSIDFEESSYALERGVLHLLDQTLAACLIQERDIVDDLRAMLCADALATSRSTLGGVTIYHTRASTVYFPCTCDGDGCEFGLTPKSVIDARSDQEADFKVRCGRSGLCCLRTFASGSVDRSACRTARVESASDECAKTFLGYRESGAEFPAV